MLGERGGLVVERCTLESERSGVRNPPPPCFVLDRVASVREKSLENDIFSRSGKSQGISILVREI